MTDSAPTRTELLDAELDGAPSVERVHATRIEMPPGQAAGPHHHPCDVVGQVLSGTIRFQLEGGEERELRAGDAFHEPAKLAVPHFDNASQTEPAAFLALYLLPPGERELIVMHDRP